MSVHVKLWHPDSKLPTRATDGSAAYDFYAPEELWLPPRKVTCVPLGIAVAIPEGFYLQFLEKSGLSVRTHLVLKAGLIDADYRGELQVVYYNAGETDIHIEKGMKIVQGVLQLAFAATFKLVDELESTERGNGGFGSTGRF